MIIAKAITAETTQIMQEHTHFQQHFLLHQYFQYTLHGNCVQGCYTQLSCTQSFYQPIFFCTYNFHSLHTDQYHMIYYIHAHNYQNSKYILCRIYLYHLLLDINTFIYHYSNVVYYYKHSHLIYIYTYMFHLILCVVFYQS